MALDRSLPVVRDYVFVPAQRVRDRRTDLQTTDAKSVLDGSIDPFIRSVIRYRAASRRS